MPQRRATTPRAGSCCRGCDGTFDTGKHVRRPAQKCLSEYRVAFPGACEEISALRKEPDEMSLRETLEYAHLCAIRG